MYKRGFAARFAARHHHLHNTVLTQAELALVDAHKSKELKSNDLVPTMFKVLCYMLKEQE